MRVVFLSEPADELRCLRRHRPGDADEAHVAAGPDQPHLQRVQPHEAGKWQWPSVGHLFDLPHLTALISD